MNFFDHKDLGNHLLQLCPKVVKHPVYGIGCNQSVYGMVMYNEFEFVFVVRKLMNITALALCDTVHINPCEFLWKVGFLRPLFLLHLVSNAQGILGVPAHILSSSREHFLPTILSSHHRLHHHHHHHHITRPFPLQVLLGLQVAIITPTISHHPLQAAQYQQLHIME